MSTLKEGASALRPPYAGPAPLVIPKGVYAYHAPRYRIDNATPAAPRGALAAGAARRRARIRRDRPDVRGVGCANSVRVGFLGSPRVARATAWVRALKF